MTQLQNTAFKMKMAPVPFVGDILPKAGAMVVSEHDGHIYYADKYGWHKADAEYTPVILFIDFDGVTQFKLDFRAPVTSTLIFHDGDGTVTELSGNDSTTVSRTTTYTTPGKYTFYVLGDIHDATYISLFRQGNATGDVSGWYKLSGATTLQASSTACYGDISEYYKCPLLTTIVMTGGAFTGDISGLNTLSLTLLNLGGATNLRCNKKTVWSGDDISIRLEDCEMKSIDIDNCIFSFKEVTNSKITIGGIAPGKGNAARTINSDSDLATLLTNANTIEVSENRHVGTLGPELHEGPNAASDPAGNEADAVDGWVQTGLDAPNEFISVSSHKKAGSWSFKTNANNTPTANAKIVGTITVEALEIYRTSIWMRHLGLGLGWRIEIPAGNTVGTIPEDLVEFKEFVIYATAAATSLTIEIQENSTSNNGGLYIDDISVRKVTLP